MKIFLIGLAVILVLGDGGLTPARSKAGGEVLLKTDFSRKTSMRFDRPGVWSVRSGRLHAKLPSDKQQKSFAYLGSEKWADYAVEFDVYGVRGVDKGVVVRVQGDEGVGIDLRGAGYNDVVMYRGKTKLGEAPATNRNGRWHHVRVEVHGARYRVYVDRDLKIEHLDPENKRPAGRVALAAYTGGVGECELMYDNVAVHSIP